MLHWSVANSIGTCFSYARLTSFEDVDVVTLARLTNVVFVDREVWTRSTRKDLLPLLRPDRCGPYGQLHRGRVVHI